MSGILKQFLNGIFFVAMGITSIAISAWQYKSSANGIQWVKKETQEPASWVNWCDSFPVDMLRPLSVTLKGLDAGPSYCGYSDGNSGYRLGLGCVTLIMGVLILLKIFDQRKNLQGFLYCAFFALWSAAFGIDVVAIANGQSSCVDAFHLLADETNVICDNSEYGISITVDMLIVFIVGILIYFFIGNKDAVDGPNPTTTSSAARMTSATEHSSNGIGFFSLFTGSQSGAKGSPVSQQEPQSTSKEMTKQPAWYETL